MIHVLTNLTLLLALAGLAATPAALVFWRRWRQERQILAALIAREAANTCDRAQIWADRCRAYDERDAYAAALLLALLAWPRGAERAVGD